MSHRIKIENDKTGRKVELIVIVPQADEKCSECGQMVECRPYGAKGAPICYDCGFNKHRARTAHNMAISLFGAKGELQ